MKIVGFGDSFTAGDWDREPHPDLCYIAELCKLPDSKFDCWENHARGGYSNIQIAFAVYKYLVDNQHKFDDVFIMIGWSSFGRYSLPNFNYQDDHTSCRAHDVYEFGGNPKLYPKSTNLLIHETDIRILGISALLKKYRVPFAMIQAFDDHTENYFSTVQNLPNWINGDNPCNTLMHIVSGQYLNNQFCKLSPNTQYFESGWIEKIQPNQYIAKCWHPSLQGHQLIAKTLYPYLEKISVS